MRVDKSYGSPFGDKLVRILAFVESTGCESGLLVCVRQEGIQKNVTLDSHWLHFIRRPDMIGTYWEDDIPFSNASHSTYQGERLTIPEQFKEEIYFD